MIGLRVGGARKPDALIIPEGSVRPRDNGRHPGGRPPVLDQERGRLLLEYLRLGEYLEIAVAAAGIDDETFRNWRKRANEDLELGAGGPFVELFGSLKQASATAQIDTLRNIRNGVDNWQASAWFKERTSSRWRRRLAIADLDEPEEHDADGIEVRVHVVTSRPAPALDVEGSSRITEPA